MVRQFVISLLIMIHLYAYKTNRQSLIIFIISAALFIMLFSIFRRETKSTQVSIIQLMCVSIPIAWRNILGGDFSRLPLPWFYVLGVILIVYMVINLNPSKFNNSQMNLFLFSILFLIYSFIPFINGGDIGDYLTYSFFGVMILGSVIYNETLDSEQIKYIKETFIITSLITSLWMILEYIIFHFKGISLGREIVVGAGNRIYISLMFEDMSSAGIFLASAALLCVTNIKINIKYFIYFIIMVIGLTLSSTRTGLAALFLSGAIYIILSAPLRKKIIYLCLLSIGSIFSLNLLEKVRPAAEIASDSGRLDGYIAALETLLSNPVVGLGFNYDKIIATTSRTTIPHLTLLYTGLQGGLIYIFLLLSILVIIYNIARKRSILDLKWTLVLMIIGSFFIPELFSTRFIIIPMIMIIFYRDNVLIDIDCDIKTN